MLCVRGNRTGRCNRLQAQSLRFYPLNRYHRAVLTEELANEPYPVILGCRGVLVADGGMFHPPWRGREFGMTVQLEGRARVGS
jgi:hypothetical protein